MQRNFQRWMIATCLLSILSVPAFSENLILDDYIGGWETKYQLSENEKTFLTIAEDFSGFFSREIANFPNQHFTFNQSDISFIEGNLIIALNKDNQRRYNLVVSGWKQGLEKHAFGTIYIFRNEELINGLPIYFESTK